MDKKLPSYEELFGNLDYSSADEYRSVLSPAAYLADIMNLKNWNYDSSGQDNPDAVDDRRPDISDILLNAENTITEIPHLDIVNDVMEKRVEAVVKDPNGQEVDAFETLKNAKFPFNVPFNKDKTEIQNILEYLKTDAAEFYKLFTASPDVRTEAREYLGLSQEEHTLFTSPVVDDGLKDYYGLKSSETIAVDLVKVTRFRKACELSALQVTELLFQNLSDDEKGQGVSQAFFINGPASGGGYLVIKTITINETTSEEVIFLRTTAADGTTTDVVPGNDYFDRIHRFIRVSRKTGLSFEDLDLVLTKACNGALDEDAVQVLAVVKWLQDTYEVPVEEICTFFSSFKDYGKGETTTPADQYNRVFNNDYETTIDTLSGVTLKNRVQACLRCNESEYNAIVEYLSAKHIDIEPTPSRLALPYRLKKLATLFEMPVESLFTLFALIDRNYSPTENKSMIERAKFPLPVGFSQTVNNCADIITSEGTSDIDSVKNILWLVQLTAVFVQWLNEHEMTVEQLEFICTEHSTGPVDGVLTSGETEDLLRDLNTQFGAVLFKPESLVSGVTDKLTADLLYEKICDLETGVCTDRGILRGTTTAADLESAYLSAIREKLFIEPEDLTATAPEGTDLEELFLTMQNRGYLDQDAYISSDPDNRNFFANAENAQTFLADTEFSAYGPVVFKEIAQRTKAYSKAYDAKDSECEAIAEKISVQAGRQRSTLVGGLEDGLSVSSDIVRILCATVFRTTDETQEMATVRFMTPLMEAFEKEAAGNELAFDASFTTSFRRLQQFGLLVSKAGLKARELDVLFVVKDVQNSLPEKLRLPAAFTQKIDAIYSDEENYIYVISGGYYVRFSGVDYSPAGWGSISNLDIPAEFKDGVNAGINAALRDWAPTEAGRQMYYFSNSLFCNAARPATIVDTALYWGKVRNNIAENNAVTGAYRAADGTLYLFSSDQYVRYSGTSRDYVDEGYPKNSLRNWNNEGQVQLPVEIRRDVDSVVLDSNGKSYFFSGEKFADSSDPTKVQKTREHWAKVKNNIVDNNKIDDVMVKNGKTYIFSGDQYARYSSGDYSFSDEGYPRKIGNNWNNEGVLAVSEASAPAYLSRIDAALNGADGKVYLFNGSTFISTDNGQPVDVNSKWGKVLNNIELNNTVDAALVKDGKTYLFSGDQYFRYSGPDYTVLDEGYPKKIANWNTQEDFGTFPEAFNSGISAAFTAQDNKSHFFSGNQYASSEPGTAPSQIKDKWALVRNNIQSNNRLDAGFVAPDGKTYLFSGDQFYRYKTSDYSACDEGYPKKIKGNWGNLPDSFWEKIDAALTWKLDGIDRLYLFRGSYYVRYSGGNFSQIDPGYPKELDNTPNPEGAWFEPIFKSNPAHQYNDKIIKTIFTDLYNGQPRINYFFHDRIGIEKLIKYEYINNSYKWSDAIPVSTLTISPFTSVDVGFRGADGRVFLFSGSNYAVLQGNYSSITPPTLINGTWGKVVNRFQDLNRVDEAYTAANGRTYLFCDTQYVRYSGDITPANAGFYVDEGYPKTIAGSWSNEDSGVQLPAQVAAQGFALLPAPDGVFYIFSGNNFTTATNDQPVSIKAVWGRVENNFESLNRVDAAFVHGNKTYLFCGNQYTRYSGGYSGYADESYPRTIANIGALDGIEIAAQFPEGITAIMDGADGALYVFAGKNEEGTDETEYVSSIDPSVSADVKSRFGIVRNNIADTGIIDAVDATESGVLYLFSGDQYVRYSAGSRVSVDESYPKTIANWGLFEGYNLPDTRIKARFTDHDGVQYYFVKDTDEDVDKFFTVVNGVASEPVLVSTKWGKVQNNIQETGIVDAAFIAPNGKTYLFSGDQYVQYTPDASTYVPGGYPNTVVDNPDTPEEEKGFVYVDEGFPKTIADNWGDLPAGYRTGIDAGFVFDGRTYFFKGNTYIRYSDPACKTIDSGYPKAIATAMNDRPDFQLNDVKTYQQFKALSRSFSDTDNTFLSYLEDSRNGLTGDEQRSRLSSATEWTENEIGYITLFDPPALSITDLGDIQVLTEMKSLFDASESMASLPSTLKSEAWDKIYKDPADLTAAASLLRGQLKAVTGAAAWSGLSAELHNKMNLAKRDALLGYLIDKMEQVLGADWVMKNPRDLYEYLLIDVEMAEEAVTSRIQEAIMCMRLFYHRTLMNLEDTDQETMQCVKEYLKAWWIWMKSYRVWEANRKVFLYPENYIRPELRLDKSPEFKELEEALLQGDISDETADHAYKTYLDKFSVVSRLKIAGGYYYQRGSGDTTGECDTAEALLTEKKVIIFGYSNTEPKKYYYMTGDILEETDATGKIVQTLDWAPWKEIGITIDAEKVYPVYSFNRLFVFWVEVRERDQSSYSSSVGPDKKITQYDPVIYYSFYNLNGEWTNPQKLVDLGGHVDKLDATTRSLFIDDKNKAKNDPNNYIPAKEVLNGAKLYVTNPITRRYYDAGEFIYISYEARYITKAGKTYEFAFAGKLKSNLEFQQDGEADLILLDKLDKNVEFPEKFGIATTSDSHWKGFSNDSFSAPWFSFNAEGGGFLIKPAIVPEAPVIKSDKQLYGVVWTNLPDAGFTDRSYRKHLFYRDQLTPGATQYYTIKDDSGLSNPVPVTDVWGKRNIFQWYPEGVESAVTNADKTFIATAGGRYISYTGQDLMIIDQASADDTLTAFSLGELLPSGATPEQWHRVKEDLGDFINTLENAFVYSNDNNLYLVANPLNENGVAVREYTIPDMSEFWAELAALVPETGVADTLRTWTTVRSANVYTLNGNKRLYITSGDNVYVKDYIANTNSIYTVADLTHPDLMATVYDPMPARAMEKPWVDAKQNLMEFLTRVTGVGNESGSIRPIAAKQDGTYEYIVPVPGELFDVLADIINDVTLSPIVAALTELSAADLYVNGTIKRLYIRSSSTAVIYDYTAGAWSVKSVGELIHPDVTAKVPSLTGLLPSGPAVPWADVAEDFGEYMKTVQGALAWKGVFYLYRVKPGGGYEYIQVDGASAASFWSAVGETLPAASSFTAVDSACIVTENGTRRLFVTFNEHVAVYDFATYTWSLSSIGQVWQGAGFTKIDGLIQAPDGKVYIFNGRNYAEKTNDVFTSAEVTAKWGYLSNVITDKVDAAFMDGAGRAYLFTGRNFIRYSNIESKIMDLGYPKTIAENFGINMNEVKELFSADISNVSIDPETVKANTAFMQKLVKRSATGEETEQEKTYLFMDITAVITRYTWKWRWRWWGSWYWRWYFGFGSRLRSWWGWWWREYYLVKTEETVRKSVYLRFSRENEQFQMDPDYPKMITGNWSNLPGDFNKMITGTFEDTEGTDDAKKDVFYVVRGPIQENNEVTNDYVKYTGKENFPKEISEEIYEIIRLTSNTSEVLLQKLFLDGIDGLLSLDTQKTPEIPIFEPRTDDEDDIEEVEDGETTILVRNEVRKDGTVLYKPQYISDVPSGDTLDFGSINGQYYWEIFFHAPFLIAQAFNNAQNFNEGNRWYEYIFDPTETYDPVEKSFWKFLPFHEDIDNSQSAEVNNLAQYNRYLNDPFEPHAIAGLRQVAYRKAIVMTYIDNLLDWGDMLFRQYTRETINEARMLYVLGYDLLGKKPELLGTRKLSDAKTYKQLREESVWPNMALIEMENLPANAVHPITGSYISPNGSLLDPYGYFYIPENREFEEYWNRVEDRLYKIRYSLNLDGVKQRLPLFEPPLDVMALVRAVGSGMGLAQALADFNVDVPHYRFAFILGKARELTSRLTQFGQSFLSALEKKDAEELALLRNTHEKAILKLTLDIKNAQLQDSEETLKALRANLKGAKTREGHYTLLLASGLSPYEQSQLGLLASAQMFTNLSQVFSISSSVAGLIPEVGPFAFHFGGHNLAALFTGLSQSFNAISNNMSYRANLASILGGYFRRGQDWGLQLKLAQADIENIERQIAGAEIKVKVARLDIETAKTNIKNLESVDTFMKGKFTNLQLYRWMTGKLAGLYFQTYQMALDMAKWAQKSFQFELGYKESEVGFITSLYWDSLKKGLLAGETLQVDLDRMEKAYIEKNKRRFEISKTVSLAQLDPLALLNLREKRVCEFTLGEELFDYDFPGHYRRQIKTISLTFPAVAGPYENINATLTQLSHRTLIEPDKAGAEYLLTYNSDGQPLSVRADWRTNQQIALSRGVNDAGLFQLNFQDERYLPFEGTGAVSTWRLELNGQENAFDVNTLSDVIIKIEYTALQGGEAFAATVKKKLPKNTAAAKLFNLSQDFSAEWNSFMEDPSGGLNIKVTKEMFPNMSGSVTGLYMLFALSKEGVKELGDMKMKLKRNSIATDDITLEQAKLISGINPALSISSSGSTWKLVPDCGPEEAREVFTPENISNIALVCGYSKKPQF